MVANLFYALLLQLSCCTQNADSYKNEVIHLESQPTCIVNGYVHDDDITIQTNSNKEAEEQTTNDDKDQSCQCPDIQYIIIDMAPVTFIDSSGSKMLERVSMSYLSV